VRSSFAPWLDQERVRTALCPSGFRRPELAIEALPATYNRLFLDRIRMLDRMCQMQVSPFRRSDAARSERCGRRPSSGFRPGVLVGHLKVALLIILEVVRNQQQPSCGRSIPKMVPDCGDGRLNRPRAAPEAPALTQGRPVAEHNDSPARFSRLYGIWLCGHPSWPRSWLSSRFEQRHVWNGFVFDAGLDAPTEHRVGLAKCGGLHVSAAVRTGWRIPRSSRTTRVLLPDRGSLVNGSPKPSTKTFLSSAPELKASPLLVTIRTQWAGEPHGGCLDRSRSLHPNVPCGRCARRAR
jgi:hypothetical protein